MYKITLKKQLSKDIKLMGIEAEHVVRNARAGNFVILIPHENGERIPLTIYDWDKKTNVVYIIFQEVGVTTAKLGMLNEGDSIFSIAGPLGRHFHIEKFGNVAIVGGGVGVPAIFPIARALKEAGNTVTSIMGFRTKELIILEKEMESVSNKLLTATNDGSQGQKGLVTDVLLGMINSGVKIDLCVAVGPVIMMKAVSDLTKNYNIRTIVSLNALMMDGTGMCGGCRVTIGGKNKFSCVDGPDFDGHLVDFAELTSRLGTFKEEEKISLHHCKIQLAGR
jgi:ferredoxin--NADP+ reductase